MAVKRLMRNRLSLFPPVTLALFLGPVLAGIAGTVLPAFGYLPALDATALSLAPWRALANTPGVASALGLSLTVGFGATLIAFLVAVAIVAALHDRPAFQALRRLLAPALAVPHAGFAIGLAFLIAPSGWLARVLSPWATGWALPPDLMTLHDPAGLSLMLTLALKETFFILLMILAALGQSHAEQRLCIARVMGYRPATAWLKVVLPAVYPQIRLPLYAVLAYALSVVDVSIILGPTAPPPFAVLLFNWFRDFDLALQFTAAAGAIALMAITLASILVWRLGERAVARLAHAWLVNGGRGSRAATTVLAITGGGNAVLVVLLTALSIAAMALWAMAQSWYWPDAMPSRFSLAAMARAVPLLGAPLANTLLIGLMAVLAALVLVIGCLEHEVRSGHAISQRALLVLYLPLLLPQIGFLFGVQTFWIWMDLDGGLMAVAWTHILFVLPIVYLTLADPYRALDPRIGRSARTLGASPLRVVLSVKLPLLARPVMTALAIGFSVSVAQYLPTLFAGGGRVATLTTEAVGLATGADRRLLGLFGFVQAMLPLFLFAAAMALPAWMAHNRKGLSR